MSKQFVDVELFDVSDSVDLSVVTPRGVFDIRLVLDLDMLDPGADPDDPAESAGLQVFIDTPAAPGMADILHVRVNAMPLTIRSVSR